MAKTLKIPVKQVCHTTAEWEGITTVPYNGCLCIEFVVDTNGIVTNTKAKVGDGSRKFTELPYIGGGASGGDIDVTQIEAIVDDKIEALGSIFTIKGTKATKAELPSAGNKPGDVWFVGTVSEDGDEDGDNNVFVEYVWTSDGEWEFLGSINSIVADQYTVYTLTQSEDDTYKLIFKGEGTDNSETTITLPKPVVMTGATTTDGEDTPGKAGYVPAPTSPDAILFGDGTWTDDIVIEATID